MRRNVPRLLLLVTTVFLLPVATNTASSAVPSSIRPFLWLSWLLAAALAVFVVAYEIRRGSVNNRDQDVRRLTDELAQQLVGPAVDYRRIARGLRRLPVEAVWDVVEGIQPRGSIDDIGVRYRLIEDRAPKILDHMRSDLLVKVISYVLRKGEYETMRMAGFLKGTRPAVAFAVLDQLEITELTRLMDQLFIGQYGRNATWGAIVASRSRFPKALRDLRLVPEDDCRRVLGLTPPELTLKVFDRRIGQLHKAIRRLSSHQAATVLRQHRDIDSAMMLVPAQPLWAATVMASLSSTDCGRLIGWLSLISANHAAQILDVVAHQIDGAARGRAILRSMPEDRMFEIVGTLPPQTAGAIIATADDEEWARLFFTDRMPQFVGALKSARILDTLAADQALAVMQKNIDKALPIIKAGMSSIGAAWPSYVISLMDEVAAKALLAAMGGEPSAQLLRAMEPNNAARLKPPGVVLGPQVTSIE